MRRKSSADELRKDAAGSDELYGGMTASKDMAAVIETSGRDGYSCVRTAGGEVRRRIELPELASELEE